MTNSEAKAVAARRTTASPWFTLKVQVVFVLLGAIVPLAALLGYAVSSGSPDSEGGWWPLGVLGYALLSPGILLSRVLGQSGETISWLTIGMNGVFWFAVGTALACLEGAKRKRLGK